MPRILTLSIIVLATACTTVAPPPAAPDPAEAVMGDMPLTMDDRAVVLRLEDRREFDGELAATWISHPSYHHRARMARALGRIGTATFIDEDGDGQRDEGERMAGVDLLTTLRDDPNPEVRTEAAFALGEIGDPAGVAALLEIARGDEHAGVRSEAIEALSKLAAHVALPDYLRFVQPDEAEGVRRTALRYLFRFDGDEALAAARTMLADENPEIRRAATYTFSRRAYPPALAELTELLESEDLLTRSYAARAVDRIADPSSLDPLLDAVLDVHPWVRTNVLRGIASIATAHPDAFRTWATAERLVPLLTAADDPDPGTKATAIETLSVFAPLLPSARERLVEIASEDEPAFRESAVTALARAFPNDTELLDALLETDSRWIRGIVLRGVAEANQTGPSLRARYAEDPDATVRSTAIGTIPDERVEAEKELILRGLEDPDPIVRASAMDRAAKLTGVDVVAIALQQEERARRDEMNDARLSAIGMFIEARGAEAEPRLRQWLRDDDPMVRRAAADAIEQLGLPRPQYTPIEPDRPEGWYSDLIAWASEPRTAVIDTVRGPIEIVLLTQDAPITAKNFADLAASGYFDNTSFMRVVPNFVIQGGDPRNDMTGGPGYAIRDEINLQEYTRGAVGMALSGPDTGGSQFFITHSPQHHLDGGYTIFGRVTDGMTSAVDEMRRGDRVTTIRVDEAIRKDPQDISDSARDPLPLEVGEISPERTLETIPLYVDRMAAYTPDPDVMAMMAPMIREEDHVDVFLGTWCRDSQKQMPHFYKIVQQLRDDHGVDLPVEYVAVDRSKSEPAALIAGSELQLVPTFIVYRGEDELGRIVESPVSLLEDDLLAIFAGAAR